MKIDRETAELDFNKFTEILKLSELKLDKLKDEKEDMIQLIQFGYLRIGDEIMYNLDYPLPNGQAKVIKEVKFKTRRLTVGEVEKYTGNSKNDIELARRMLSALIGMNSAQLKDMDAEDFTNLGKISAYFLPR